jgi:hypothetical protein
MSITQLIIEAIYTTGSKIYVVMRNKINGQVWNNSTLAFEVFNSADWASYAIPLTEQAPTGYFWANRPAGIAGTLVSDSFYLQAGTSPATTDTAINLKNGSGENIAAVSGDPSVAPTNLQSALSTEVQGSVIAGTITNSYFPTSLTASANNTYIGRSILFTSGAQSGNQSLIQGFTASGAILTVSPLPGSPAVGDTFIIV